MRLDINYGGKNVKNTNTWRLNNTFLNNQQVTEEIKREIKKFLETNDNENITTQNLWDVAKAVLRGKLIAIQSYLKKPDLPRPTLPFPGIHPVVPSSCLLHGCCAQCFFLPQG